ncbi:hypothetical protein Vadar_031777 [Vaccinium darrowii]|uniref:Uncharacterized protein n=1 Tax=Vaccinium darrowii TaxID=229202 RepID=A0ACB7XLC0_9ERIC|nr:hypothetical protein Vadar_031777 [Vaccinium darrowii]
MPNANKRTFLRHVLPLLLLLCQNGRRLPMELVLPTVFTITYWMGSLKPSLPTFSPSLLIVLFNVLVSQGLRPAIGAILKDVIQAETLAAVIMFVF